MHAGVNIGALETLLGLTDLPVIAAGGVSTLEDLEALYPLGPKGLEGVITGRAIYEGTLDFAAALEWLGSRASVTALFNQAIGRRANADDQDQRHVLPALR
jgi:phosphoribosylformimino-5-aminoimidazole carboxamide ribotide isomerase